MRSVTYESILQKVCQLCTGESEAGREDQATLNVFIDERVSQYWREFFWPEACEVEQRTFRPPYDETKDYLPSSATVPREVYYPPTRSYYQCVNGSFAASPEAPAYLESGTWVVNKGFWAPSTPDYSGDEWKPNTTYPEGTTIRNPADERFYWCHTEHVSGSAFDADFWGILTPFLRTISYTAEGQTAIDAVEYITEKDPRIYPGQHRIAFDLFDAIVVRGELPVVWVKFRRCVDTWIGAAHQAGASYTQGQQVYYGTDYYRRTAAGSGTEPPTDTSVWEVIEFPYIFRSAVPRAAYADWLDAEGQQDKSGAEERRAQRLIDREMEIIQLDQNQSRRLNVRVQ